jgi:hypothetical protein
MVLESHYTVDTDQRQQGEVHAAISIHAGSWGRHSRLGYRSEGTQLGELDAAGTFRAQSSEVLLLRSRRRRRRGEKPGDRHGHPESALEWPIALGNQARGMPLFWYTKTNFLYTLRLPKAHPGL